jgi:hypothetical protein
VDRYEPIDRDGKQSSRRDQQDHSECAHGWHSRGRAVRGLHPAVSSARNPPSRGGETVNSDNRYRAVDNHLPAVLGRQCVYVHAIWLRAGGTFRSKFCGDSLGIDANKNNRCDDIRSECDASARRMANSKLRECYRFTAEPVAARPIPTLVLSGALAAPWLIAVG